MINPFACFRFEPRKRKEKDVKMKICGRGLEKDNLVENACKVGNRLLEKLDSLKATQSHITDVRGRGLMIGIELDIPHKEVRSRLIHDEHCFTGCASTNILRLLPPLCLTEEQADTFIEKLKRSL